MKVKTTINEATRSYQLEGLLVIIDPGISIEEEVKEERKKLYLEYKRDIEELSKDNTNLDRSIKKFEKKMFYLIYLRNRMEQYVFWIY